MFKNGVYYIYTQSIVIFPPCFAQCVRCVTGPLALLAADETIRLVTNVTNELVETDISIVAPCRADDSSEGVVQVRAYASFPLL